MGRMRVLWLAIAPVALACGAGDVGRMARVAEPHAPAFATFERWVQRAHAGETALSGPTLIREATFSPIRNRQVVLAAQITVEPKEGVRVRGHGDGKAPMTFPAQAAFPSELPWVAVKYARHGILRVAEQEACELDLPGWWREGVARACVLISRTSPLGVDDRLTVTMAFSRSGP